MKNAQISVKVATITGAAKNDVFLGVNEDGRFTLDVLANDPGAAVLYSVYQAPSQLPGTTAFEVVAPSATLASGSIDIVDGIVVYTANGSQQSLAQGESAGESFIYTVRMANGALSTATATFMVNGVNDIAVISGDAAGAVSEDDTPAGNLTDSGSLTFTDVDLTDVHLVSATGTPVGTTLGSLTAVKDSDTTHSGTGGQLTWTYTVADSAVEYLAADQTKLESFTLTLDDQHGGLITKQIDVTITGTNDAPVVSATDVTGAVTEQVTPAGNLTDSGAITFTDVDLTDVHLVSATGTPVGTTLGSLTAVKDSDTTHSGTGGQLTWTYTSPVPTISPTSTEVPVAM